MPERKRTTVSSTTTTSTLKKSEARGRTSRSRRLSREKAPSLEEPWIARIAFFTLATFALVYICWSILHEVEPMYEMEALKGTLKAVAINAAQRHSYTMQAIDDHGFAPRDILIVAHRGCWNRFPENSLPAIAACAEEGAQLAEVDISVSKDGIAVLSHDKTPYRVVNEPHWGGAYSIKSGARTIDAMTFAELQKYWLVRNEFSGSSTPHKIPSLEEALQIAKACGIHLQLDSKNKASATAVIRAIENQDAWQYVLLGPTFSSSALHNITERVATSLKTEKRETDSNKILEEKQVRVVLSYDNTKRPQEVCMKLGLDENCSADENKKMISHLNVVGWSPLGDTALDVKTQCTMRHLGPGTELSFLWDRGGEFYIRDPSLAKKVWKLNTTDKLPSYNASSAENRRPPRWYTALSEPCPEAKSHEAACLGAHLWIPPLRQGCARYAITDMPAALRSALLAFDMAPTSGKLAAAHHASPLSWPFDSPALPNYASHAASLSLPPKCMELSSLPRYNSGIKQPSSILSSTKEAATAADSQVPAGAASREAQKKAAAAVHTTKKSIRSRRRRLHGGPSSAYYS